MRRGPQCKNTQQTSAANQCIFDFEHAGSANRPPLRTRTQRAMAAADTSRSAIRRSTAIAARCGDDAQTPVATSTRASSPCKRRTPVCEHATEHATAHAAHTLWMQITWTSKTQLHTHFVPTQCICRPAELAHQAFASTARSVRHTALDGLSITAQQRCEAGEHRGRQTALQRDFEQ